MKPHIGLNADYVPGAKAFHKLYADYTRAVQAGGGVPVVIPALEEDEDILSILATIDGLVLTGGEDLDPASYRERPHPSVALAAPERQRSDMRLVELALVMEIPILGICMGCQLVNVVLGGTLIQDISSQHPSAIEHSSGGGAATVMHLVEIAEQTRLHSIVKAGVIMADSTHHQAVKDLGKGLVVTARAEDDTIEAVELPGAWILGVQWHPERLIDRPEHRALFEALVAAASAKA